MHRKEKINPELNKYKPIIKTIAEMFGAKCEVLIHDFTNPQHSIISIENGQVTGRKVGDPITDFALSTWKKGGFGKRKTDRIINYKTKSKAGKVLKSSTVFIKDDQKNIIGCICINYDISEHNMCKNNLIDFCTTVDLDKKSEKEDVESFASDVNEILKKIIKKSIEEIGKPVYLMQKEDKLLVVKKIEEKGAFLIKGSINQIAKQINVSRYTIYNYLEELKTLKV